MTKFNILNLVLFVIVISLAFIIYYSEEEDTRLQLLTDIDLNHVNSIRIHHNKNSTSLIKHDDGHWWVTQPVSVAANDFRLGSILKLLNAPIHNQYPLSEVDTDKVGLADPATTVELDDTMIYFGIINPATNLRYIRLNQTVFTIEDVYYPLISANFSALVSLNLLAANDNIEKLVLINQTIDKDDGGLWRSNIKISADNIVRTIEYWQSKQAFGAHKYLQRDELGEVSIYIKDQAQPVNYIISDTDPWLILARPDIGLEYHLDIEAYEQLISPVDNIENSTSAQ